MVLILIFFVYALLIIKHLIKLLFVSLNILPFHNQHKNDCSLRNSLSGTFTPNSVIIGYATEGTLHLRVSVHIRSQRPPPTPKVVGILMRLEAT